MCRFGLIVFLVVFMVGAPGCKKTPATTAEVVPDAPAPADIAPTKSREQVLNDLKSTSSDKRTAAISAMAQADPAAAIPVLVQMLSDKSVTEGTILGQPNSARETAILALLKLGSAGEKAAVENGLPILAAGLKDSTAALKEHTILAIALLGPKAKSKVGDLLNLCQDADENVRRAAFLALNKIGGVTIEYALMLKNPDPKIVYDVAKALNELGAAQPLPKEIVPGLIDALESPPQENEPEEAALARVEIAEILGRFGADALPAVPALIDALKKTTIESFVKYLQTQTKKESRAAAETPTMAALRKIGKPAVPALTQALDPDTPFQCWMAARILGGIGPDAAEAVPALQKVFDSSVEQLQVDFLTVTACGPALYKLGADPAPIVAKIVELLKLANTETRLYTAYSLSLFGRKAGSAAIAMVPLLEDENEEVRSEAISALKAFGPASKDAVPALAAKLADPKIRPDALAVLSGLGPFAAEATPALINSLGDKDEAFRRDVIAAIKAIGPGARAAVPELIKLIKAVDPREYLLAIEALGRIGADAKTAIPALIAALNENKGADVQDRIATRMTVSEALGSIGIASPDVVKALAARLKDTLKPVRVAAARSLAMLGPPAKAAAEDLKMLGGKTRSPESDSAVWSAAALYKLGIDTNANLQFVVAALKNRAPTGKQARLAAMGAADLLGPTAKQILPELIEALNDNTPLSKYDKTPVRFRAVQAIGKMGPAAKDAVPKLTGILKEPDPMKSAALDALGQIGPPAVFAVARLREIIRTEPSFAQKAQEVLDLIEK